MALPEQLPRGGGAVTPRVRKNAASLMLQAGGWTVVRRTKVGCFRRVWWSHPQYGVCPQWQAVEMQRLREGKL